MAPDLGICVVALYSVFLSPRPCVRTRWTLESWGSGTASEANGFFCFACLDGCVRQAERMFDGFVGVVAL